MLAPMHALVHADSSDAGSIDMPSQPNPFTNGSGSAPPVPARSPPAPD
jgi:hypothetical protein